MQQDPTPRRASIPRSLASPGNEHSLSRSTTSAKRTTRSAVSLEHGRRRGKGMDLDLIIQDTQKGVVWIIDAKERPRIGQATLRHDPPDPATARQARSHGPLPDRDRTDRPPQRPGPRRDATHRIRRHPQMQPPRTAPTPRQQDTPRRTTPATNPTQGGLDRRPAGSNSDRIGSDVLLPLRGVDLLCEPR